MSTSASFTADPNLPLTLDLADPLADLRGEFHVPAAPDGTPVTYLCGNSLGLQPRRARDFVEQELRDWARLGVEGHFEARTPWYRYHEVFRKPLANLVGGREDEVVLMNSLTVNLHLLLTTFYRPETGRDRVVMEWPLFPSDLYAVTSHLEARGVDPAEALVLVRPEAGAETLTTEALEAAIAREGERLGVVLVAGVNFLTGQVMDVGRITRASTRDSGSL